MITEQAVIEFMAGPRFMLFLIPFIIWDLIWRGVALWKAGKNNHLAWFIALFLVNSLGILPIIYIVFFQKGKTDKEHAETLQKKKK